MADFDQRAFEEALDKFYRKLESLQGSVGRGTSTGATKKTGPVPRAAQAQTSAQKESEKLQKQQNARTKEGLNYVKKEDKARKELTGAIDDNVDAIDEETRAREKSKDASDEMRKGFANFGKSLFKDKANLTDSFDSLSYSLERSGSGLGKILGGVAFGMGSALGLLKGFADTAADFGAFADLSKFSVGAVAQLKLMSGLGGAFTKVIEESQGQFRSFGSNTQDAAENLSNLSRGLKYGSSYLNSTLTKTLGKDLVKSVDEASNAAAAMGVTDEERAKLLGQIARTSAYGAKNEQDAQKRLVQQYADTIKNTRTLSNTFGVSSKAILQAMEEFRNTTSGQIAALEGNVGAQNIMQTLMSMGVTSNKEAASQMALALSEGNLGLAQKYLAESGGGGGEQRILELVARSTQGTGGGADAEAIARNIKAMRGDYQVVADDLKDAYKAGATEYGKASGQLGTVLKNIDQSGKTELPGPSGTTEADNIKSMNSLTAALESLRNVILGLTAGIAAIAGAAGTVALGGVIGGIFKGGGLGKIKDLITSYKTANQGPQLPGKGSGIFERIFGAGSGGDKAADAAGGKLDAIKGKVKSLGDVISDVGKGIGNFLKYVGKGLGGAIQGIMTGVAKGLEAFGNPAVLKGAGILAASIAVIGAGLAAAAWLIGKALPTFAEGLKSLTEVDGSALISIGAGLAAIGAGATVFAAGMIAGTAGSVITGLMSLFGAKSPLERVKEFVPIADKIGIIGNGIKNFGEGIGLINSNLKQLDLEALAKFKDALISISDLNLPNLDGLRIPSVSTNVTGDAIQANTTGLSSILQNGSITPEVIGQVLAYLANIENDLQAIRGNTKGSTFDTPVRLA